MVALPLTSIGLLFWVSLLAENTNINEGPTLTLLVLLIFALALSVKYSITRNIY